MSFYDNILGLGVPVIGIGDTPPDDRAPDAPQAGGAPAAVPAGGPAQDFAGGDDADRRDNSFSAAPQSPGSVTFYLVD